MALTDLLWACPTCGRDRGLEPDGREAVCTGCGTRYRRDRGADIRARFSDGSEAVRTPAGWVDRLPPASALFDGVPDAPVRIARATRRDVVAEEVVRARGRFLNRVERFGDATAGEIRLWTDRITFRPDGTGDTAEWRFADLTAVQASSRTLQLKGRGRPLASFRFQDDSIFLWELLLNQALQLFYRRTDRGEIVEFQPRITTAAP